MCGRSRQCYAAADIATHAQRAARVPKDAPWVGRERYAPTPNLHPGREAAVLVCGRAGGEGGAAALRCMRWGLVPAHSTERNHWRMFNARSETLLELATFGRLVTGGQRCAMPVEGWFEWKEDEFKEVRSKQPFYVQHGGGEPLWCAGLYDVNAKVADGDEPPLESFTLITRDAAQTIEWLHERQPVLLDAAALREWLDPSPAAEPMAALRRCAAMPAPALKWHPVTKKLSKLEHQDESSNAPVKLASQQQPTIASLFKPKQPKQPTTPTTPTPTPGPAEASGNSRAGAGAGCSGVGTPGSGSSGGGSTPGTSAKGQPDTASGPGDATCKSEAPRADLPIGPAAAPVASAAVAEAMEQLRSIVGAAPSEATLRRLVECAGGDLAAAANAFFDGDIGGGDGGEGGEGGGGGGGGGGVKRVKEGPGEDEIEDECEAEAKRSRAEVS